MLSVEDLTKKYKNKTIVNNLSFNVEKGQIFALLGSNGAGKSTTIKMILGLVKKDGGNVEINPEVKIGYSPETPYFPPFLTGEEVLSYYLKLQKLPAGNKGSKTCKSLLEKVGLIGEISMGNKSCKKHWKGSTTLIKHYSKGMLQRLALAQSMLGNPDLLILDEPCAGLDAMGRIEMLRLLEGLRKEGKTILINSHILSDLEKICDCGIIIKDGKECGSFDKNQFKEGISLEKIFVDTIGEE